MNSKMRRSPNKHFAPHITPNVETSFHFIIHSCLNRCAHCFASNRENYEDPCCLEVRMAVRGIFLVIEEESPIVEFFSYIYILDFLYT